jgi:tetratricopeptide (TPR) repeat protein
MSKKQISSKPKAVEIPSDPNALKKIKISMWMIIGAFAFIIYGNSIFNNYALDDMVVIVNNDYTHEGIKGIKNIMTNDMFTGYVNTKGTKLAGGRYRPLSLVTFAIEYEFIGQSPHFSHFINVLLFAFCGIGIFIFTSKILSYSRFRSIGDSIIPFLTAMLFIAHPIHTEVVANIKSRDEILSLLFSIFSMIYFLKYLDVGRKIKDLSIGILLFFLGLLSKENSITFLMIIPLTLFFFRKPESKDYGMIMIPIVLFSLIFIFMRSKFASAGLNTEVPNILNNPLVGASVMQKMATITYTLGAYILLLLFPYYLSCDYDYNQIPIKSFTDVGVILSLAIIIFLAVLAIRQFKKRTIISYSIFFFAITFILVSNILFPIGTTMAERFVFIPSFGFCFVMAYFFAKTINKSSSFAKNISSPVNVILKNKTTLFLLSILLFLYSARCIARNADWKDNLSLFSADVITTPNSANLNKDLGSTLVDLVKESPNKKNQTDTFNIAKPYLKRAIEIYPLYFDAFPLLGVIYYIENNFDSAYYYQKQGLEFSPDNAELNFNFGKTLDKLKRYDEAIKVLDHAVALDPKNEGAYFNLALSYTNKGDIEKGLFYFLKVTDLNPKRAEAYYYEGQIYNAKKDTVKAKEFLDKAAQLGYGQRK